MWLVPSLVPLFPSHNEATIFDASFDSTRTQDNDSSLKLPSPIVKEEAGFHSMFPVGFGQDVFLPQGSEVRIMHPKKKNGYLVLVVMHL